MLDFVNRFKVVTLGARMTKQKLITLKKTTEEEKKELKTDIEKVKN